MLNILGIYFVLGTLTYVYVMDLWARVFIARKGECYHPNSLDWWAGYLLHILIWPYSTVKLTINYYRELNRIKNLPKRNIVSLMIAVEIIEDWILTYEHADFCPSKYKSQINEDECKCMDRSYFNIQKNLARSKDFTANFTESSIFKRKS